MSTVCVSGKEFPVIAYKMAITQIVCDKNYQEEMKLLEEKYLAVYLPKILKSKDFQMLKEIFD